MRGFYTATTRVFSLIFSLFIIFSVYTVSASAVSTADTLYTTDTVNLRAAASTSSSVIQTLSKNTTVTLLQDSDDGWAYVRAGAGKGYIFTDYLQPSSGSYVKMQGVTAADVNFREGKGTSTGVICVIEKDTTVEVTDNTDESWAKVLYDSKTGYVSKDYLTIRFILSKDSAEKPSESPASKPQNPQNSHRSVSFENLPSADASLVTDQMLGEDEGISKLMFDQTAVNLNIHQSQKLSVYNCDRFLQNAFVSFSSSDPAVARVSSDGVISGISQGCAVISAVHHYTDQKATCTVTVSSVIDPTQAPTEPPTEKPTQPPTQPPTEPAVKETLSLSATEAGVYAGCYYHLKATSNVPVTFSSSDPSVATIDSNGIVTTKKAGSVILTAKTSTKSAFCRLGVYNGRLIDISHTSATVTAGKTFFASTNVSGAVWVSSDESVASVQNGFILGKKPGKAVMSISTSSGGATCLVTVEDAAPVRFAYTSPNCVAKNAPLTLIAITDQTRSAVKFEVGSGSSLKTVNATSKVSEDGTFVWKGTINLSSSGTYPVRAYSRSGASWQTCDDAVTSAFVTANSDYTTTVCAERRASDQCIAFIAQCEGYIPSVYYDDFTGDPTLGYGKLVFLGQQFYNSLTRSEAYAYLVQTVNNDGYGSRVSSFLVNHNVKFNQQQFDSLVCLVYSTGTGILTADNEVNDAILNCSDGSGTKTEYFIDATYVNFRSGPGTGYRVIQTLDYGAAVTLLSDDSSGWYHVSLSDGTKGYVSSSYVSKRTTDGNLDLSFVNKQNYINKICQYHHAGGGCVRGLLNRRIDEMEMFFYGDYDVDYGANHYHISFTCANNSSFHS